MNNKPSNKTTIKYLLYLLAYVKKHNISNRWDVTITRDTVLMEEFDLKNNQTYLVNRLLELGVLYCYDDSYYHSDNSKDGKCRNYEILLSFFDELESYLPYFFDLPDNIINHKYIKEIKKFLIEKATANKELIDSNLFLKKSAGRPKINIKYSDYLSKEDYKEIVDKYRKALFTVKIPDNDITKIIENYDITKVKTPEEYLDYVGLRKPTEEEKKLYPNITNLLKNLRKRNYSSLQKKSSFSRDILTYDGYHYSKSGRLIKHPVYKEITPEEEKYIKKVYTAYVCNQPYVQALAEHIKYLRSLGQEVYCRLNVTVKVTKAKVFISHSARQYNPYCSMKNEPIKGHKEGQRDTLFFIDGFDKQYDLHSAVFIVARLLNTGNWYKNPIYKDDIKLEILSKKAITKSDGKPFDKNDLKALMFRIFFNPTRAQSVNSYIHSVEWDNKNARMGRKQTYSKNIATGEKEYRDFLPVISISDYEFLYDTCIDICGDLPQYRGTIFFYESILECMVMEQVLLSGKEIRNTYDCFYYKSSDYSEDAFIRLVDKVAKEFYIEYTNNNYSLWWDDLGKLKVTTF